MTKSVHFFFVLILLLLDGAAASQSVQDNPIARKHLRLSEKVCIEVCEKDLRIANTKTVLFVPYLHRI